LSALEDLEHYLMNAQVIYAFGPSVVGGGGHGQKFAIVLEGAVVLYAKPGSGVADGGIAMRNEKAAWELIKAFGWSDMMGATVVREVHQPFSDAPEDCALQVMWPGYDFCPDPDTFPARDVWRAAIFDYVITHTDRGSGAGGRNNWLGVPKAVAAPLPAQAPSHPHLKLIDHGYAFDPAAVVSSAFVDAVKGDPVPPDLLDTLADARPRVAATLMPWLDAERIQAVERRMDDVLRRRAIP
jgi:hypothetical protein